MKYPRSVQFSHSVVSNSLQSQHAKLPCPSPNPEAYSNSCPSSRCNHLILCRPLLFLPSIFPSIRVFSKESVLCIKWPKYWSFSISPSNKYSGLISFRMDCKEIQPVHPKGNHWKGWCWNSNILATWCKELTPWKRPWCWERLKAGG